MKSRIGMLSALALLLSSSAVYAATVNQPIPPSTDVSGSACPSGSRFMTPGEARANLAQLCDEIEPWARHTLSNGGLLQKDTLRGICTVSDQDPAPQDTGRSRCIQIADGEFLGQRKDSDDKTYLKRSILNPRYLPAAVSGWRGTAVANAPTTSPDYMYTSHITLVIDTQNTGGFLPGFMLRTSSNRTGNPAVTENIFGVADYHGLNGYFEDNRVTFNYHGSAYPGPSQYESSEVTEFNYRQRSDPTTYGFYLARYTFRQELTTALPRFVAVVMHIMPMPEFGRDKAGPGNIFIELRRADVIDGNVVISEGLTSEPLRLWQEVWQWSRFDVVASSAAPARGTPPDYLPWTASYNNPGIYLAKDVITRVSLKTGDVFADNNAGVVSFEKIDVAAKNRFGVWPNQRVKRCASFWDAATILWDKIISLGYIEFRCDPQPWLNANGSNTVATTQPESNSSVSSVSDIESEVEEVDGELFESAFEEAMSELVCPRDGSIESCANADQAAIKNIGELTRDELRDLRRRLAGFLDDSATGATPLFRANTRFGALNSFVSAAPERAHQLLTAAEQIDTVSQPIATSPTDVPTVSRAKSKKAIVKAKCLTPIPGDRGDAPTAEDVLDGFECVRKTRKRETAVIALPPQQKTKGSNYWRRSDTAGQAPLQALTRDIVRHERFAPGLTSSTLATNVHSVGYDGADTGTNLGTVYLTDHVLPRSGERFSYGLPHIWAPQDVGGHRQDWQSIGVRDETVLARLIMEAVSNNEPSRVASRPGQGGGLRQQRDYDRIAFTHAGSTYVASNVRIVVAQSGFVITAYPRQGAKVKKELR